MTESNLCQFEDLLLHLTPEIINSRIFELRFQLSLYESLLTSISSSEDFKLTRTDLIDDQSQNNINTEIPKITMCGRLEEILSNAIDGHTPGELSKITGFKYSTIYHHLKTNYKFCKMPNDDRRYGLRTYRK